MHLPVRFPNDADVIYQEAEAYRRLSPRDRLLALMDLIASGTALLAHMPALQREAILRQKQIQEEEWQRIHKGLFARWLRSQ